MAYLPHLHYCGYCNVYLGPDDGDGICGKCEDLYCYECGNKLAHNNKSGVCWECTGRKAKAINAITSMASAAT